MKRSLILASLFATISVLPLLAAIEIVTPAQNAEVPLLNEAQRKYVDMPESEWRENMSDAEWRKTLRDSTGWHPAKVRLAWSGAGDGEECAVEVKRAADGKTVFAEKTANSELEIDNLEIATEYEWTVSQGEDSATGRFRTEAKAPRCVRLGNVPNMRDFGGWTGLDGRRVKQGLVYRSGGLNNNANSYYRKEDIMKLYNAGKLVESVPEKSKEEAMKIQARLDAGEKKKVDFRHLVKKWHPGKDRLDDESRKYAAEKFGIKTDLDLRSDRECYGMTGSPLGPGVKWVQIPIRGYGSIFLKDEKKAFAKCFRVFLDEANYPICFHCIAGADRTGSLSFILKGILGVDEKDLVLDWEITAFQNKGTGFRHTRIDALLAGLAKLPGADMTEKTVNYVKSCGFTDEDIGKFRSIMLEPAK